MVEFELALLGLSVDGMTCKVGQDRRRKVKGNISEGGQHVEGFEGEQSHAARGGFPFE